MSSRFFMRSSLDHKARPVSTACAFALGGLHVDLEGVSLAQTTPFIPAVARRSS